MIDNCVLMSNVFADVFEDVHHVALKSRLVKAPASQPCKGLQLIVCLQPINRCDAHAGHTVREPGTSVRLAILAKYPANADWEDRDIVRVSDLFCNLVEGQFAEGINAGADQNDVLMTLNAVHTIERVVERVEHISF